MTGVQTCALPISASLTRDTYLILDDNGIHVRQGEENQTTGWKQIKRVSKKPTMIVIFTDTTHGYVLTRRILGERKAELYAYISEKIGGQPKKER